MARKSERYPALYERLSHDDELQGESNSISNQKRILEDYAEQHGFTNCIHFTDDGISGTQFDRPGFQKMIAEVKADRISVVIIKDMSRFGRDYLQVGTYMEVLRKHDTRLIALNDSVDTLKGDDEFTPFRNIMNEWYARDTSKKIRSAFQAKNLTGKHTSSSVPYGYLKSEQDKNQWVIDPVAAPIVQRIYRMTMEGKGPYQIAAILSAEHIEIPAYYHQKLGIGLWQTREIRDPYKWGSSTIVHILTNPCYLGHTCNFKTRKHFKDKKSHYVDQDQWTIIENTQEPIIDQETYDNVQRIRAGIRRYPDGWGEAHPLGGLLYCADCGSPMYVNRTGNGKRVANFSCSGYGKIPVGSKCSSGHRVNADSVMALIQETLREIVQFSKEDEEEFVRIVKAEAENQQSSEIKGQKTRLAACKKRLDELETLICKIYEDNALGKLPDKRYQILDAQYAKEQESLEAEAASLQKAVDEYESGQKSADKFIALVKKYQNFEKLDTVMLNEFIYKIFVHERDYKGVANSPQTIEIYFNFIGKFGTQEVNQPTEEERAEIAEKERLRKKRHEAYLRRKANGWQDAYYQKHKQKFISQIMTSKSPVHSCEDVDEQALSYAEIKALCAGNPLIKEKMDLDVQVAKLKVLKADHQSQKFRLQDKLLTKFPADIRETNAYIAGVKADAQLAAAHPQVQEGFCGMTIKGVAYDEKKTAGERLVLACSELPNAEEKMIGSFRGFELSLRFDTYRSEYQALLKGQRKYTVPLGTDPLGNIIRLDNSLNSFPERITAAENELDTLHQQQAAAQIEVEKPFPQEEELAEKSARLAELNAQLDVDEKSHEPEQEEQPDEDAPRPSVLAALEEKSDKPESVKPFRSYYDKDGDAR